jgi:hypothetical protein
MGEVHHLKSVAEDRKAREARNLARPRIAVWHRRIDVEIREAMLIEIDGRLARALTSFPSANDGVCWPGQLRLAATLGKSDRTIRRSISRLERRGFLVARQQGWDLTNCYMFMLDGKPLIPGAERAFTEVPAKRGARTSVSSCNRTSVSSYLLESDSLESESLESSRRRPSKLPREKKRSADHKTVGEIIDHVVRKLGNGNDEVGWSIYRQLPHDVKVDLRNREREGTLDDESIESFLYRGSA